MFVALDFDLNAVAGGAVALVNVDELRQALCVPNNPIMSNSCKHRVRQMSSAIKQIFGDHGLCINLMISHPLSPRAIITIWSHLLLPGGGHSSNEV